MKNLTASFQQPEGKRLHVRRKRRSDTKIALSGMDSTGSQEWGKW